MDGRQDGGNVIHIIGGDESDIRVDRPVSATMYECNKTFAEELRTADLSYEEVRLVDYQKANVAKLEDTLQTPALGSSSVSTETDRSCKSRYCKMFSTDCGSPFGDNRTYNHDQQSLNRETTTLVLGHASAVCHRNGGATGNQGPVPPPARPPSSPLPIARGPFNANLKPPNWRTRICIKWEQAGYCPFGSKCNFAHGEAELQRYGGGPVSVKREANLNNRGLTLPNRETACVAGPSVSSGGSQQQPEAAQRSFQKWPKKINRIYGDWIDDLE